MQPSPLFKEIVVVLLVKAALLFGLWTAFFSDPVGDELSPAGVAEAVFGPGDSRRTDGDEEGPYGR